MVSHTRSLLILALGMALGIAVALSQGVFAVRDAGGTEELPLDQLRTFVEILNRVKQGYVEDVGDEELLENAIRGMLDGLDPHSAYLNPEEFKEISISTTGKFGGLGIEVQMQNGFVRVVAPIDDTPAKRAGIQAGDLIIRIDDTAVKGMSLMDAVKMMRGEPGTDITLTILREELSEPFKVDITRDIIRVKSVKARMLEPGYGYIRITQFSNQTGQSLIREIENLKSESEQSLKGLVLDLRNNPGGVLDAAVAVSDAFLDEGEIVSIKGRAENAQQRYRAEPGDVLNKQPIVVLVNEGSASASEIVAGALQDKGRAVIMGSRTFGKGSVQTIVPLQNDAALKLTTARYYTPSGRSIQAEGIKPDVEIQPVKVTAREDNGIAPFLEADLSGSLENPQTNGDGEESGKKEDNGDGGAKLAERDYALYEALNLLKGLHILSAGR